jgi:DNA repair exonuclease SbcCD ATPase subunit
MQDLRQRLNAALKSNSELEHVVERQHRLLREAKQVNAELQQLREQVTTLTRERDRYRNQLAGAIEHSSAAEAQAQLVDRLQAWLRPVLELVAEHPEDASPLAVAVLGYLPGIASRLIEE